MFSKSIEKVSKWMPRRFSGRLLSAVAAAAALAALAAGCGSGSASGDKKLLLVAYSTPREAYGQLIPDFEQTGTGKGWSFTQSFGPSGDQSRAVASGLPADVVAFSLEPDVSKLVDAKLVDANWNKDGYNGIVTRSVVVLAVRKGNPKHIRTWADLIKPGVQVVTPNPFTSGGARWNVMAAYGAQIAQGKTPAQARDYVKALFKSTVAQDKSARESLQTFAAGKGDVLLAYENEAITAQKKGQKLDYVIPPQTILIENPIAVIKDSKHRSEAVAFVRWLRTPPAQRVFAANGYRPVLDNLPGARSFATPPGLFTIAKFGGWSKVSKEFFDPAAGVIAKIEQSLGVSTAK